MISDLSRLRAVSAKFGPRVAGNLVRRRIYRKLGYPFPIGHRSASSPWGNDYRMWVKNHDTLTRRQRNSIGDRIEKMERRPRFSVVMPVYDPAPNFLREAIESVRSQLYPDWELCIADDASTDDAIQDVLREYLALDPRIKVDFRASNGHICAASNSAVALATTPWIVLMDHDDVLAEEALFCVAQCISECPDARLIYSDEDKIDEKGQRSGPYFKPDWNLDLFRSHNITAPTKLPRCPF